MKYLLSLLLVVFGLAVQAQLYTPGSQVSAVQNGSSTNVGVATSSPQTLLNVNLGAGDATIGTAALRVGGTGNYPSLEFGIKGAYDGMISTYGNDLHIYAGNWRSAGANASENHNISFYTSQSGSTNWNTPKMYLRYDGNVGIGTTSPNDKFSVSNRFLVRDDGVVRWGSAADFGILTWDVGRAIMGSQVNQDLALLSGGTERIRILAGGNVGIGTTNPLYKLEVNSAAASNLRLVSNGSTPPNPTIDIYDQLNGTEFVLSPSAGKVDLFTYSNHALAFGTGNSEKMRIGADGNVGIGTTSPGSFKLAVEGKIGAREVNVTTTSPWPDYVFETDYRLQSLDEIKAYVDVNKHLPDVPSAKDIEANGVNLGEMNMILLKKIEELTLYILEQQKRIETLEQKIKD